MVKSTVSIIVLLFGIAPSAYAGYYSTIDPPADTRWNRDYDRVFKNVLLDLGNIGAKEVKQESPIRDRYILIETLGRDGTANLKSWEQKLDYSTVLIRRGKAYEATQVLQPLTKEQPKNFLVWSHLATAYFLSNNPDFRGKAVDTMDQALSLWPENMDQVDLQHKKFLQQCTLGSDVELDRFKRIETFFRKLMRSRLREERFAKQKKPVDDGVDPIFVDETSKEDVKPPVSFLNEEGKFEVGRIAKVEKAKLPGDAAEIVMQLLIWMPTDQRLKWLLGEVLNASVMDCKPGDERNDMIRSVHRVFKEMDSFEAPPPYGAKAIKAQADTLAKAVAALPPPRELDPARFGLDKDKDLPSTTAAPFDWWRTLGVGFLTGLAVGMFAVWQIQEYRRRRQPR